MKKLSNTEARLKKGLLIKKWLVLHIDVEQPGEKAIHRQWEICWVDPYAVAPTVYRNSFGAQWTDLQEQRPCYSADYKNDEVTTER